jgi:predicted dinucleotide-binding enzyme
VVQEAHQKVPQEAQELLQTLETPAAEPEAAEEQPLETLSGVRVATAAREVSRAAEAAEVVLYGVPRRHVAATAVQVETASSS